MEWILFFAGLILVGLYFGFLLIRANRSIDWMLHHSGVNTRTRNSWRWSK